MALKALGWIENFQIVNPETFTYKVVFRVHANGENATGEVGPFAASATSLTVNTAIRDGIQDVAENELGESFTPILDYVVLLAGVTVVV